MKPRERRETGEQDLFRSRLDQIIDMGHALAKLAGTVDWVFLEKRFGAAYTDGPGQPPLPTRLMAGRAILKHTYGLSDEALCDRWLEGPYFQYFCDEEFFQHRLKFGRSSLTRWRQRMGEEKLLALRQESLATAVRTDALKPSDLSRVVVDTTVQPKNAMFPTDARLLQRAREILVWLVAKYGVALRQSYRRVGKFAPMLSRAGAVLHQRQRGPKVYSLHAPEVECIGKGKAHKPYEFGVKASIATPIKHAKGSQFVLHAKALPGNPYDGHTLKTVIPEIEALIGSTLQRILADAGYRGHNAPPRYKFRICTAGQKRRVTPEIKRQMRRRSAIEPVIGHLKAEHRMDRNYLAHRAGDAANTVLAAAG